MESKSELCRFALASERIVHSDAVHPGIIVIEDGIIAEVINGTSEVEIQYFHNKYVNWRLMDYGSAIIMPGIVDSHVHVNEPGRSSWEGFHTATAAAAAGGVTTIVDMPLNSIPPTITLENLKKKAEHARDKIFVDVAFWAGVIPGNQNDLIPLIEAGVVGFKCFLCPSGVDEFPSATSDVVETALRKLKSTPAVLAFHAEHAAEDAPTTLEGDPTRYETFLNSRPGSMEEEAIKMICDWCKQYNVKCHIVHLSTAEALHLIKEAKKSNAPLTVETCPHYLTLSAEEIPSNATEFKCCPPIRNKSNQDKLWAGLKDGTIDMVVSDHSPCTEDMKIPKKNFMTAWGGISSLQFGLPLLWTAGKSRDLSLTELSRLLCERPAALCNLFPKKGAIRPGSDADLVIWNPDESFAVRKFFTNWSDQISHDFLLQIAKHNIRHRNKLTPYLGKRIYGKVTATILRGRFIYERDQLHAVPIGKLLLNDSILRRI